MTNLTPSVCVVGIGQMGLGIAKNIQNAGYLNSIFEINISQIIIKNNLIRKFIILYPIFRILSKFTGFFGFDLYFCRYQSIISLYSLNEDKRLYPIKQKGDLINILAD